ncbi:MAG: DNA alkylation repair protein [Saprospiraceae bacterium]|nr:DNA alkylation repair protein [Saprospiraceae bacterium]
MTPEAYYRHVRDTFRENGNHECAQMQIWYTRYQFDFFGLKMPQWMGHTKTIHKAYGIPEGENLKQLARLCFEDDHREMHYFALETVQKSLPNQPDDFIYFLEELIVTRSWWDTVDWIAKLVGLHFRKHPQLTRPVTEKWMDSGHIWLQRVCLIFQLAFKEKTDAELMFEYIRRIATSKEFFLQKGAGWALRQYAKTNPEAVKMFVANTRLAALTTREALRILKKEGRA